MTHAPHAAWFDASALVKLYVEEPGSAALRSYWAAQPLRYTTPFCLYEALSILKGYIRRGALTKRQYLKAATNLVTWFRGSHSTAQDIDFFRRDVFADAKRLAERHDLDLSDAFQLLTLHVAGFSQFIGGRPGLLVTADEPLASAARAMKLSVWNCMRELMPVIGNPLAYGRT